MRVKRIFAMILAFMLVFSMLPASVLADEQQYYTVIRNITITGPGEVKSLLHKDEKTFKHYEEGSATFTHTVQVPVGTACAYQATASTTDANAFGFWYKDGELYYAFPVLPIGQPSYVLHQQAGDVYTIDTVEVRFVARTYNVNIHFEPETGGSVEPVSYARYSVPAAEWTSFSSTATPDEHHNFAGWYYGGTLFTEDRTMTDSVNSTDKYGSIERTYTAKFTPKSYEVVFYNAYGTEPISVKSYPYGTPASEIEVPEGPDKENRAFLYWMERTEEGSFYVHEVTGPAAYYPQYTMYYYSVDLTFNAEGNGAVSMSSFKKNIPLNKSVSVTCTAVPSEGSIFAGWYKDGVLAGTDPVLELNYLTDEEVRLKESYTAKFLTKYNVGLTVTPEGSGTVSGAGEYTEGETVEIAATAYSGYSFDHWEYGEETLENATYSFAINEDRDYVAVFKEDPDHVSKFALEMPEGVDVSFGDESTAALVKLTGLDIVPSADGKMPVGLQVKLEPGSLINKADDSKVLAFQTGTSPEGGESTFVFDKAGNKTFYVLIAGSDWDKAAPGTYSGSVAYSASWVYADGPAAESVQTGTIPVSAVVPVPTYSLTVGENITATFGGKEYTNAVIGSVPLGDEVELRFAGEAPEGSTVRYIVKNTATDSPAGTVSYPGTDNADGKYAVLTMPNCDATVGAEISTGYIPEGIVIEESFDEDDTSVTAVIDSSSEETVSIPEEVTVDKVTVKGNFTKGRAMTLMLPFSAVYTSADDIGATFYTFSGVEYDETEEKWIAVLTEVEEGATLEANTPYVIVPKETSLTFSTAATLCTEGGGEQQISANDWAVQGVYEQTDMTGEKSGYGFVASGEEGGVDKTIDPLGCYLAYTSAESGTELPENIEVRIAGGSGESLGQFVRFAKDAPASDDGHGTGNGSGNWTGNGTYTGNTGSSSTDAGKTDDKTEGGKENGTEPAGTPIATGPTGDTGSNGGDEVTTTGAIEEGGAKKSHTLLWVGLAAVVALAAGGWFFFKGGRKQ